ncbi:hypothetical protein A7U60_g5093 [Sanghuangporus baumii]|uniref:Myb/SANT-like domain-containing protein n=1 Tax=Sanghuangporus baumii TaxID=108892 RepID=A0A9Q5HXP9_SANBA|nr:hypothetical protein A7U60_g5093 [Sanghuangporus baumii]
MAKGESCTWTAAQEAIMVDILKQAKDEGQQSENGWKKQVFERVVEALDGTELSSGGVRKGVEQVKNRYQRFKAEYRDVKKLRDASGFGWDDTLHLVTATADVWERYLAVHKDSRKWKERRFPLYDDIAYLVEGIIADGHRAFRPGRNVSSDVTAGSTTTTAVATATTMAAAAAPSTSPAAIVENANDVTAPPATATATTATRSSSILETIENAEMSDDESKTPVEPVKQATESFKKKGCQSGAAAIFALSESIESVISAINTTSKASGSQPSFTSPQRKTAAIRTIEEDEGLSDTEMVEVADMIRERTDIADAYLALTKKTTRTAYLRRALDKYTNM